MQKSGNLHSAQALEKESFSLCTFPVQNGAMTDLLEKAIERVRAFPPEAQDDFARVLLRLAGDDDEPVYQLTPEEEADLDESDAEAARGEFATDEEVAAIWAKHGL